MTDTTRVYVNTTDGHWYYYDSSEEDWLDGGVYQSTAIDNNEIDYNNIKSSIVNNIPNSVANNLYFQKINYDGETFVGSGGGSGVVSYGVCFVNNTFVYSIKPVFETSGTYSWNLYEAEHDIADSEPLTLIASGNTLTTDEPIILNRVMNTKMFLEISTNIKLKINLARLGKMCVLASSRNTNPGLAIFQKYSPLIMRNINKK